MNKLILKWRYLEGFVPFFEGIIDKETANTFHVSSPWYRKGWYKKSAGNYGDYVLQDITIIK